MLYLEENNACKIKIAPREKLSQTDEILQRAYKAIHRGANPVYQPVLEVITFEEHDSETDEIMKAIFGDKKC